ncbi:hypothetical protein BDR04DRAFT_1162649 [Suillus decipiens]|nr:hypothetical protein BDR04DRAFT_1162649 [Suillus decipiens]
MPPPHNPHDTEGGTWLDPHRTELMGEVLWENLKCIKKQRQWREQGVSERQAKWQRREDEEAMKPFAPSVTTHAGPSGTSNPTPNITPPAPPAPPPIQPSPLEDNDTAMMETEATNEVRVSKNKNHESKR